MSANEFLTDDELASARIQDFSTPATGPAYHLVFSRNGRTMRIPYSPALQHRRRQLLQQQPYADTTP